MAILHRRKQSNTSTAGIGGTAGWRPLSWGQAPWEQIGAYDGSPLNQYPAHYDQPQLRQGVEGLRSNWQVPTVLPVLSWQQTQNVANVPGAQRYGAPAGAPVGPLSAKAMRARVASAQVRQSGMASMSWAQGLSAQYSAEEL